MATYEITSPDGQVYEIEAPDDASEQDVMAYAQQNFEPLAQPEQPQEEKGFIENYIDNASIDNVIPNAKKLAKNTIGGLVRGAGSIGATIDSVGKILPQQRIGNALQGKYVDVAAEDKALRQSMDDSLESMGVDTDSSAYQVGKLGAEIAGTAGMPITAGRAVGTVAPKLGNAIATGGFKLGASGGNAAQNALLRTAGGAASGGMMAGAVNPEDAATGAVIGAAIPASVKAVGKVGAKIGGRVAKKAKTLASKEQLFKTAKEGKELGYVIPPADLNPSAVSEVASSASGKIKTAQFASERNQQITNSLVKKSLGLADDSPLDDVVLSNIRKQAGEAYNKVADIGLVTPSAKYSKDLDEAIKPFLRQNKSFPNRKVHAVVDDIQSLKTESFDAGDAIETIKVLRSEADSAYRGGDNLAGKAYKKAANTLEEAIDAQLTTNNAPNDVIEAYRGARKTIAKTYTVEKALNAQTGNINAAKLAKEFERKKPLDGELLKVAKMASAFPKSMQMLKEAPKSMSPLDYYGAVGMAAGTGNPLPLAMMGARPAIRNTLLSTPVQNRAIDGLMKPSSNIGKSLERATNNPLLEMMGRSAPVAATQ